MLRVKSKVWLECDGKLVLGDGRFRLLAAIEETGSINMAAKQLNMSFRHAWSYLRSSEQNLGMRLVERRKGGRDGGGSVLTAEAKILIHRLQQLNQKVKVFTDTQYGNIFKHYRGK